MAQFYRTPGVYIEELPSGLRPMDAVGTSTAGFVGTSPNHDANLNVPTPILDFSHFTRVFATDDAGEVIAEPTDLALAVMGFFQNGGQLCYVVNVGDTGGGPVPGQPGTGEGVDALNQIDDIAIVAIPGFSGPASYETVLIHCETRKDRVAILDGPPPDQFPTDTAKLTAVAEIKRAASAKKAAEGESDVPPPAPAGQVGFKPRASERGFGAFYVPYISMVNPFDAKSVIDAPPSGHLAGIYARTDTELGVHHAPANKVVRGAVGISRKISAAEQAILNPAGVNCIRHFSREGTLVWGARTIASDPEWQYVNVRRLFCMIEQTIMANTRWAVFQPNSKELWGHVDRTIRAFLMRVWRSGALFGSTPEQAFFVQCDAETNPPEVRDAGMVVTVIGVAPVKPAEFVVFQVTQHNDGVETVTEGAG